VEYDMKEEPSMTDEPSLSGARKRTARLTNFEDGLWDLLLGMIFVLLAVYPVTRDRLGAVGNAVLIIGGMLLLAVLQALLRKRVSTPRLGWVKGRRSPAKAWLLGITIALFGLTCLLFVLTLLFPGRMGRLIAGFGPQWLSTYLIEIIVLLVLVCLFSAMGFLFGVPRLYGYGWLLGGANLASAAIYGGAARGFNLPLAAAAGLILSIGLILLIRFLRRYPVRTLDA
jgi:hypothetical protein